MCMIEGAPLGAFGGGAFLAEHRQQSQSKNSTSGRGGGSRASQAKRSSRTAQAKRSRRRTGRDASRTSLAVVAAVCALALAAGFVLQDMSPAASTAQSAQPASSSTVRISEVMTSNEGAVSGNTLDTSDWVEIVNTGAADVDLDGYTLLCADAPLSPFAFPDMTLAPGEYLLIYCDGLDRRTAGYALHAAFRLDADGAALSLLDADGALVDGVELPALETNHVYRRDQSSGEWELSGDYTPGLANTLENHLTFDVESADIPLVISEVCAANRSYAADAGGAFHDYIEIYNPSAEAVDLSGCYLTDNEDDLRKWSFPQGTSVPAGGYLLVYASGGALGAAGEVHASFKLASEGEPVILLDGEGRAISSVEYPALLSDQAYSLDEDGAYTTLLAPTPGMANTAQSATALHSALAGVGVYISEVMASPDAHPNDWLEIYNASSQVVDLSGWGLSDDAATPRKWRFPQDTLIQPGGYLTLFLSGTSGVTSGGVLSASFRLSADGGYGLTLSTADGRLVDRVFLPQQYTGVSYSRMQDGSFLYTDQYTPDDANATSGYTGRAQKPTFSAQGGSFSQGETLTVELSAAPGAQIYYTLDCSTPTQDSTPYTGPITVSGTTIVRACAYEDGLLPSYSASQSYLYDAQHTMRVVSLVADPDDMFGPEGVHTQYTVDMERPGHVEVYTTDGAQMLAENCGLKLHGADSRKLEQKNFKVIARGQYGANRFNARLFSERDYEEYQSFILRCSSEDGPMSRMRDSILTSLAEGTGVFYQKTELCVVYINGQYWGQYNMRERVCAASICQFEGWEGQEDEIDLVKGNTTVMRGSDDSYQAMLAYVKEHGIPDDETLARVAEVIDIENYIAYHALQIFVGNADTLNVKRYRNPNADGKWRWVIYDLDWGFYVDTNSIRRWLDPAGMGAGKRTDNSLFIALMNNATFRDQFLHFMGDQLATQWTSGRIVEMIRERYELLLPEMPRQCERWGTSLNTFESEVARLANYAKERPRKLLNYFFGQFDFTEEERELYFGDAMERIREEEAQWA